MRMTLATLIGASLLAAAGCVAGPGGRDTIIVQGVLTYENEFGHGRWLILVEKGTVERAEVRTVGATAWAETSWEVRADSLFIRSTPDAPISIGTAYRMTIRPQ